MKLYALNFTGARDLELSYLMAETLKKYCPYLINIDIRNMDSVDNKAWGNGAGWEASMLKVDALRQIASLINEDDFVASIDSDVVFCNSDVFHWLQAMKHLCGIGGIMQMTDHAMTDLGPLMNMSGCFLLLRGDIVKKIALMTREDLDQVRRRMKNYIVCENEDMVQSYLARIHGADPMSVPNYMRDGDLDSLISIGEHKYKSFYHMNYVPTHFQGVPVSGKWDIPRVIRMKNIDL